MKQFRSATVARLVEGHLARLRMVPSEVRKVQKNNRTIMSKVNRR